MYVLYAVNVKLGIGAFLDADVWPDIDPDPGALGDNKT